MTAPATPPEPKELKGGRYALLRKLGEGAQGETYEAMDHGVGPDARRKAARRAPLVDQWARYVRAQRSGGEVPQDAKLVAIKCFRVGTAKAWKEVELAEREARTLASLDHPHLPKYFEHFEEEGALYLVMEKLEGESLAALRASGRRMSVAEVTKMLEDIAEALRYLHSRAPCVVHRDIKPGNIIRRPDGSFALVDFGAVRDRLKPAGGSTVVGTFGYMAPEQFQGRASPKSDLYGLGATAITMLTGSEPEDLPHEGLGISVARALPKGTPAPLGRVLTSMLVPDPDARIASVEEALALLHAKEAAHEEEPRRSKQPRQVRASNAQRPPRPGRRSGVLIAIIAAWLGIWSVLISNGPVMLLLVSAAFVVAAVAYVLLARRSARLASRREESPKVRVAEEPARVRAAVDAPEDEEPEDEEPASEAVARKKRRQGKT